MPDLLIMLEPNGPLRGRGQPRKYDYDREHVRGLRRGGMSIARIVALLQLPLWARGSVNYACRGIYSTRGRRP